MCERKVCRRCGRLLPMEEFPACSYMPDGHLNKCSKCMQYDRTMTAEDDDKPVERTPPPKPKRPRGRPKKMVGLPPVKPIKEPNDGARLRRAWIESHRQK